MNVPTMTEDRYTARRKYAEYLHAVKQRHCAEYEALKNAYRELSRGKQVIDLHDAIASAGVDHLARPRLAAIRSDARLCYFHWARSGRRYAPVFSTDRFVGYVGRPERSRVCNKVVLDVDAFAVADATRQWHAQHSAHRAVVPTIPPSLLPAGNLSRYVTLWEADWERIPTDPMLLRALGKGLYVVLAQWDLTPLERAVLGEGFRE